MVSKGTSGRTCRAALTIALLATVDWSTTAAAQRAQPAGMARSDVNRILHDQTIPPADAAAFKAFFENLLNQFATPAGKSPHDDLPTVRKDLKRYLNYGKSGEAHDKVNEWALEKMKAIVLGKYDASAKYNAMIIICDLNETDGEVGKARPWAKALPFLLNAAQSAKAADYIKTAALIGVERYAAAGAIPAEKKAAVSTAMLELLNQATPPPNRTAQGHSWMRRRAADFDVAGQPRRRQ